MRKFHLYRECDAGWDPEKGMCIARTIQIVREAHGHDLVLCPQCFREAEDEIRETYDEARRMVLGSALQEGIEQEIVDEELQKLQVHLQARLADFRDRNHVWGDG